MVDRFQLRKLQKPLHNSLSATTPPKGIEAINNMYSSREKLEQGGASPAPSPPSTPPGFTKYYLQRGAEGQYPPKSLIMLLQEEGSDDEEMVILTPSPSPEAGKGGLRALSMQSRRRFNGFCACLLALLSLLLVLSFLLHLASYRETLENRESHNKHYRGHPLLLFGSLLGQAWTGPLDAVHDPSTSKSRRLPQCIIIGARKCGTRALIDMLNLHPQVEKAALEVHFFDRDENFGQGLEWYRSQMPETREDQICLEKSPSYFVTPEVPERIHGMNSSIKLLLIVREPVTRVISDYTQIYGTNCKGHNGTTKSSPPPRLEDLVLSPDGSVNVQYKAIRISMYARYLQRWLDVFPLHQLHIIDGDALIRDPYPVLKDVERFLGLQPRLSRDNFYFNVTKGFYCWRRLEHNTTTLSSGHGPVSEANSQVPASSNPSSGLHCLNDSKGRRHPQVDMRIVSKLRRFYNPHNLRFYDMVSRDFGWPEQ